MFIRQLVFLVVGVMLAVNNSASARDYHGEHNVLGYGTKSCGAYVEARRQQQRLDERAFEALIGGYITATNYERPNTIDIAGNTHFGRSNELA